MITADEILDAVKKGGMDKWKAPCEIRSSERIQHKQQRMTEAKSIKILHIMGKDTWTIKQLEEKTGERGSLLRDYMHRLIHERKVKQLGTKQLHVFCKI